MYKRLLAFSGVIWAWALARGALAPPGIWKWWRYMVFSDKTHQFFASASGAHTLVPHLQYKWFCTTLENSASAHAYERAPESLYRIVWKTKLHTQQPQPLQIAAIRLTIFLLITGEGHPGRFLPFSNVKMLTAQVLWKSFQFPSQIHHSHKFQISLLENLQFEKAID